LFSEISSGFLKFIFVILEEKMSKKMVKFAFCFALCLVVFASLTQAQTPEQVIDEDVPGDEGIGALVRPLIGSIVFSIVGLIVLVIGYKIFDLVTPYNLNKEIAEENNTAAGVAVAGVLIALGLIVAAAIS